MASIKARGTRLEERARALLKAEGIRGYLRWAGDLPGRPDFVFRNEKLALFVDSCFWHGCMRHLRMPSSNIQYWTDKIRRNRRRDVEVKRSLSELGWKVVRVWEHEFDSPARIVRKIRTALSKATEKASALRTVDYFRERGRRADRAETLRILDRAGKGNAPQEGDQLPPEWRKKPGRKAANGRASAGKRARKGLR